MNTRFHAAAPTALLALAIAGCGRGSPPARSLDEGAARAALVEALDSWKAGRPHAMPAPGDPALRVADEDWLAGVRLIDYRPSRGEQVVGSRLLCPVTLIVEGPGGRRVERPVRYAVGTDPFPSVIRQDDP